MCSSRLLLFALVGAYFSNQCGGYLLEVYEGKNNKTKCSNYHHLNSSSSKCDFIKSNSDCQEKFGEGFLQYLQFPFCQFSSSLVVLGYILLFLWLIVLFTALGVTADEYFCPSLRVISETLKLSQNIAGVTFLALGNGSPDIFSSIAAFSKSNSSNGASLAVEALLGAGVFVTTVVVGSIAILVPHNLTRRPFLRDIFFYLVAVGWTFYILQRKEITQATAIGFLMLYVFYVTVVLLGRLVRKWHINRKKINKDINERTRLLESDINADEFKWQIESLHGSTKSLAYSSPQVAEQNANKEKKAVASHTLHGALAITEHTVVSGIGVNDPLLPTSGVTESDDSVVPNIQAPILPVNPILSLFRGLVSFDVDEWRSLSVFWKVFSLIKMPIQFLLNATVPVVDLDKDENERWNKWLTVLNCFLAPVFCVFVTKVGMTDISGSGLHVWVLAFISGVCLAVIVIVVTTAKNTPKYHKVFGYLGFIVSIIWIYVVANEIVNLLETFGLIFCLSNAILGLTLLAWGNSIGDYFSNTAMARQGFPQMGISACFGGPLLNLLLGFGISSVISTVKNYGTTKFTAFNGHQYYLTMGFLALSLISSFIVVPAVSFRMRRLYGVYLIILYIIFLILSILVETKHLKI